jgi:hypothetical protein
MKSAKEPLLHDGANDADYATGGGGSPNPFGSGSGSAAAPPSGGFNRLMELKKARPASPGGGGGGGSSSDTGGANPFANAEPGATDELQTSREYLTMVSSISTIRKNVEMIQKLDDKARMAADEKTSKEIMNKVDELMSDSTSKAGAIKKTLDKIKVDNEFFDRANQNSARSQIRKNLYQTQLRRFHQTIGEYNECSGRFKEAMQARTRRQLKMVDNTLTDEAIDKVIGR